MLSLSIPRELKKSLLFREIVHDSLALLKITPYAKIARKDKSTNGGRIPKLLS